MKNINFADFNIQFSPERACDLGVFFRKKSLKSQLWNHFVFR